MKITSYKEKYERKKYAYTRWSDEEPTSIKEILKKCVVENIKEEQ